METSPKTELEQLEYRRICALRLLSLLADAVHRNGDRYSGSLVPNITSVAHALADPFDEVFASVKGTSLMDDLNSPPDLDACVAAWRAQIPEEGRFVKAPNETGGSDSTTSETKPLSEDMLKRGYKP